MDSRSLHSSLELYTELKSHEKKSEPALDSLSFQNLINTQQNWCDIHYQLNDRIVQYKSQQLVEMKKNIDMSVRQQIAFQVFNPTLAKKKLLQPEISVTRKPIRKSLEREKAAALEKKFAKINEQTFSDLPQLQHSLFELVNSLQFYAYKKKMTATENLLNTCYLLLKNNPINENKHAEKRYKENWVIFYKYKIIFDSIILITFQHKSRWSCGLFCWNETALGTLLRQFINTNEGAQIREKFFGNQPSLSYNKLSQSVLPVEYRHRASTFFSASFMDDHFKQLKLTLSSLEEKPQEKPYEHLTYGAI